MNWIRSVSVFVYYADLQFVYEANYHLRSFNTKKMHSTGTGPACVELNNSRTVNAIEVDLYFSAVLYLVIHQSFRVQSKAEFAHIHCSVVGVVGHFKAGLYNLPAEFNFFCTKISIHRPYPFQIYAYRIQILSEHEGVIGIVTGPLCY